MLTVLIVLDNLLLIGYSVFYSFELYECLEDIIHYPVIIHPPRNMETVSFACARAMLPNRMGILFLSFLLTCLLIFSSPYKFII
jgi:hypothetical protein